MSKIAKIPITLKEGVTVALEGENVKVSGPKGELNFTVPKGIDVSISDGKVLVSFQKKDDPKTKALSGLTRATIANMVTGVVVGFEKKLELSGVGFRAQAQDNSLTLYVGYTHPVVVKDDNVTFSVAENVITVSGIDRGIVGNVAAKVRAVRPPEPYKGKGIKYVGEHIRKKAGKAAKAIGAKVQ